MGVEAAVVLEVGFFFGVAGIEAGDAVVVAPASLSEVVAEGKADVAPAVIGGGDVGAGLFDAAGQEFDVIGLFFCLQGLRCRLWGVFFG